MKYEEPAKEVEEVHGLKEKGYVLLLSVISEDIPRKGLKYLLDAIRITRTSNPFKLVIRGNVSCPRDINDKVIVLKRFLSRKDLIVLYNLADACIVPSFAEGFGLPIIESFAAGKPVVSLNARPMNEVNDDKTGWLVRVSKQVIVKGWPSSYRFNIPDIDDYAHKIAECVDNDKLRREKGINVLKKACLYDYRQTYQGFLDLIANASEVHEC
jgi:glycosyltransferase involved in cell wall biosynthesis